VNVAGRREAVAFLRLKGVSERRACRLLGLGRSILCYRPREGRDEALRQWLLGLVRRHPRYGCRRAWAVLRREGWAVNLTRVHRVWKELGFAVPRPRRRPRSVLVVGETGIFDVEIPRDLAAQHAANLHAFLGPLMDC
jgi:transposase InsO family protein